MSYSTIAKCALKSQLSECSHFLIANEMSDVLLECQALVEVVVYACYVVFVYSKDARIK
jgi:hypothetical protein